MLCDSIVGHLRDLASHDSRTRISLSFTWQECRRRAVRKVLPDNEVVRLVLSPGVILRQGDLIYQDASKLIWVDVQPVSLLVATIADPVVMAAVSYQLGNLHVPLQISGQSIITLPDGPIEAVFRHFCVRVEEDIRAFDPLPLPNGVSFQLSPAFAIDRQPV